jgi:hypothetical protein
VPVLLLYSVSFAVDLSSFVFLSHSFFGTNLFDFVFGKMTISIIQAGLSLFFVSSAWASLDEFDIGLGSSFAAVLDTRVTPLVSTNLPSTWTYQGCYADREPRTLSGPSYVNTTGMTDETCIAFCNTQYYIYAGTEYSQECCMYPFLSIELY